MTVRARYTFVPHTLRSDPDAGPVTFMAQCTACEESSPVATEADGESAELWALSHTGLTGHPTFRETIIRHIRVEPTP